MWTRVYVQTFFRGIHVKYFVVQGEVEEEEEGEIIDMNDLTERSLEIARQRDQVIASRPYIVDVEIARSEKNPWMERTDWLPPMQDGSEASLPCLNQGIQ
jgi:hypothetical protein